MYTTTTPRCHVIYPSITGLYLYIPPCHCSFEPDYEKSYPGKAQQLHFLRRYVEALRAKRPEEGGIGDLGACFCFFFFALFCFNFNVFIKPV